MTPLMFAVAGLRRRSPAVVGVLAFVFRGRGGGRDGRPARRAGRQRQPQGLDQPTCSCKQALDGGRQEDAARTADARVPQPARRSFEQADCNIKPSTLFGIALGLARASARLLSMLAGEHLRRPGRGGRCSSRCRGCGCTASGPARLKKFAGQLPDALELVARALRAGHSLAAGMHVVAEEMPAADLPRSSAGSTRSRTWASRSKTRCRACATACRTSTCGSS